MVEQSPLQIKTDSLEDEFANGDRDIVDEQPAQIIPSNNSTRTTTKYWPISGDDIVTLFGVKKFLFYSETRHPTYESVKIHRDILIKTGSRWFEDKLQYGVTDLEIPIEGPVLKAFWSWAYVSSLCSDTPVLLGPGDHHNLVRGYIQASILECPGFQNALMEGIITRRAAICESLGHLVREVYDSNRDVNKLKDLFKDLAIWTDVNIRFFHDRSVWPQQFLEDVFSRMKLLIAEVRNQSPQSIGETQCPYETDPERYMI